MKEPYVKIRDNEWILTVQEGNKEKELVIQFPEEALNQMGWCEGDVLEWLDNGDGSWTIVKSEESEEE